MKVKTTQDKNIMTQLKQIPGMADWLRKLALSDENDLDQCLPPELAIVEQRGKILSLCDLAKTIDAFQIE